MSYIDQQYIEDQFDESYLPKTDGQVDAERISGSISYAENLVNGYLRAAGLSIPVANEPTLEEIRGPLADIAWHRMQDHPSELDNQRKEDAMKWFDRVARGVIKIATPADEKQVTRGFRSIRLARG